MTRIVVLGGGPAGLGVAYRLRKEGKAEVVVLERGVGVGGNAGSFDWRDHRMDFGSHRLHPASDQAVLDDVRELLGEELLDRPRHGRIRLLGRWLHFPLKPVDLLFRAPPSFALGALFDAARKVLPKPAPDPDAETFSTVLTRGLGPTICEHFYFPYARKIWGLEPEQMSAIQARRRVSAGSFLKLLKKILNAVPGFKPPGSGRFFYPRQGFGQISDAYAQAARDLGADVRLGTSATALIRRADGGWTVEAECNGETESFDADQIWSTIPVTVLARMLQPAAPAKVQKAAKAITYRSMVLIYLELEIDQFTEYDAHYFPGADLRITRLSETKNYANRTTPAGRTALCAELPCQLGDEHWTMSDEDLGKLMAEDLERAGLPLPVQPCAVHAARLPQAYPLYPNGYEKPLETLRHFVENLPDLLSFGRQGLFAHDNTHHALYMALAAVRCLGDDGAFDHPRWEAYLEEFSHHVVED